MHVKLGLQAIKLREYDENGYGTLSERWTSCDGQWPNLWIVFSYNIRETEFESRAASCNLKL